MEEPITESNSEDEKSPRIEKINMVKSENKKGETSRKSSKSYEFRMPLHKGIPNNNNSSSGAINILNLDCISNLDERKRILEKLSTEISLILQTNQDDFQTAKSVLTLIEHKTEGNIQRIDYHGNKDLEIIKEQDKARRNLTRVQLINICKDIYEDEEDVFYLKTKEIIITSSSEEENSDVSSE
ncbi:hypothetical protein Tco_0567025 [Tanacetum coccineum]